jgi:hypothetical protein
MTDRDSRIMPEFGCDPSFDGIAAVFAFELHEEARSAWR